MIVLFSPGNMYKLSCVYVPILHSLWSSCMCKTDLHTRSGYKQRRSGYQPWFHFCFFHLSAFRFDPAKFSPLRPFLYVCSTLTFYHSKFVIFV